MKLYTYSLIALLNMQACDNGAIAHTPTDNENQHDKVANTLTDDEKAQGWELLFDGNTTAGWHSYNQKTDASAWKVKDGILYLDPSVKENGRVVGGGDLVTDKVFANFHLKLDWKLEAGGNSGVMFYVLEDTAQKWSYYTGPEMQILDNERHPDAKIRTHRAGDLYDLIECSEETVKPVGQWNTAEIIANNGSLTFILNGKKVVETTMWNDEWKAMIAKSKFKNLPLFGTMKEGKLVLQDHGDPVYFKNVKIKQL
ncbi:3-keto-disaccharide hydrolase [Gynurincola endophyticus]|jgi:hypothetical protein|uniref:3-keto-disaccharide hydrolase n=1 Tax=Gynurincola endophyticus TaxID=2479004 RepID=UPI000F8E987E|nr:DUF1080 domain-containing protein [Gynurincola endophyticus]